MQFFQRTISRFKAFDLGKSLLKVGKHRGIQIQDLPVFLDKAGSIIGYGLIAGQGLVVSQLRQ
jgi:hypothetical protein